MKTYREAAREIPVRAEVDVLVAGGGPGGVGAAVGAARAGVRTLLVEGMGCLGGQSTNALVVTWANAWRGGLHAEVRKRMFAKGGMTSPSERGA